MISPALEAHSFLREYTLFRRALCAENQTESHSLPCKMAKVLQVYPFFLKTDTRNTFDILLTLFILSENDIFIFK